MLPASHQTKPGVSEEGLYRLSIRASSSNIFFPTKDQTLQPAQQKLGDFLNQLKLKYPKEENNAV